MASTGRPLSTLTAAVGSVGDPDGTRTVVAIIVLLVALGLALVMVAIWLYRSTRPDPELLAPLEVMGERKWRNADPVWQRRRLDELRPEGAAPLQPSAAPPEFDEAFDRGPAVSGFDDLHHDDEPAPDEPPHDEPGAGEATGPPTGRIAVIGGLASNGDRSDEDGDAAEATPPVIERPDEVSDGDLDPELLARAMAELDAELRGEEPSAPDG